MKHILAKIKEWFLALFKKFNKKEKPNDEDKKFVAFWTEVLSNNADLYCGLYSSLFNVSEGSAKKKKSVFSEWYKRTIYNINDENIKAECEKTLKPLSESEEGEHRRFAGLLLLAAESVGIDRDSGQELIVDERTAQSYISLDGDELYIGDKIEVMSGAWYQNGKLLEQGYCKLLEASEE